MTNSRSDILPSNHIRVVSLLLALAWMGVIFYLSGLPDLKPPSIGPGSDKIAHAGAYGLLAVFYMGAMKPGARGYGVSHVLMATLAAGLYGFSDEWHQSFVPSRVPDAWDLVADVAGALIATSAVAMFLRRITKREEPVTSS